MFRAKATALCLICMILAGGCGIGQRALRSDYPQYNQTIRSIEDEHMLLNLVRLRYLETPVFLQISNITTTYGVSIDSSASVTGGGGARTGAVGTGVGYSETPTISYSLPESREFFGRMNAPLSSEQLAVLAMGGVGGFLRMGTKRINGLANISAHTGWQAVTPAGYAQFDEAITLAEELEREGLLDLALNIAFIEASAPFEELGNMRALPEGEKIGMEFWKNQDDQWVAYWGASVPHLRFSAAAQNDQRALRLRELWQLNPEQHTFPMVDVDFSKTEKDRRGRNLPAAALDPQAEFTEVVLSNRSMMEVLLYASKSVQVPEAHLAAGLVGREDGALGGGPLTIKSSEVEPDSAAVKALYNGTWFYIAADDLASKLTLLRLNVMFAAAGGSVPGASPVLTLPVR